jgi:hypothetical protein
MLRAMGQAPAARCQGCDYTWNSAGMVEGLRLIGKCPRCSGQLAFADPSGAAEAPSPDPEVAARAPHLVLGVPRR